MYLPHPRSVGLALVMGCVPIQADTVELINGDRLSGTIRHLEDGELVLKNEYLGVLRIDWKDIASIKSDSTYSILTEAGDRLDGMLAKREGEVSVTKNGETVARLDLPAVERIVPRRPSGGGASLLRVVTGAADIGYSLARGNQNQMQSSLGARATYRSARHKLSARLNSIFSKQDEARSQSRHALNTRMDRIVNPRLFAYGLAGLERNERRRLDLRSRVGAGIGWRLKKSTRTNIALLGGMAYVHERFRHEANRGAGESFLGVEWDAEPFEDVEFVTQLTFHPDVLDARNLRMELDTEIRVPISRRLTYTLRFFDRFDTTPAVGTERNDYGLVSGVGVTF